LFVSLSDGLPAADCSGDAAAEIRSSAVSRSQAAERSAMSSMIQT
jgi:hypothetical protein